MNKLMKLMINTCKETSTQIANDEDLSSVDKLKQRLHLMLCPPCRKFYEQMKVLNENIKKISLKNFDLKEKNQKIVDQYKKD